MSAASWAICQARGGIDKGVFFIGSKLYTATVGKLVDPVIKFFTGNKQSQAAIAELKEQSSTVEKLLKEKMFPMLSEVHDKTNKMEAIDNLSFDRDPSIRFEFTREDLKNIQTTRLYRIVIGATSESDLNDTRWRQCIHPASRDSYGQTISAATQNNPPLQIDYRDLYMRNLQGQYIGCYRMQAEPFVWQNGKERVHYYGQLEPADEETLKYVEALAYRFGLRAVPHPCLAGEELDMTGIPLPKLPDHLANTVGELGQVCCATSPVTTQPKES